VSTPLAALHLADGPAMYFGGTIMTFALPLGAFIVIAIALFYLFRSKHSGPRLKYLATASFTSVGTREPGPVPAPPVTATVSVTEAEPVTEAKRQAAADPEAAFGQETPIDPETPGAPPEPEE
jgi:hypothetical protein